MKVPMNGASSGPGRNPASKALLLVVFALSVLVAAITVDMVTPVLPLVREQFAATEAQISWVVSGVALVLAVGVPLYGRLSDVIELRSLYGSAVALLSAGCLLCAVAPTLPVLVLGRMIQGAGMAAIPVLSIVAVSTLWPPGKRGGALGVISGSIGVGTAGGPIFGGAIGQWAGWPSLFWITFVLTIFILIVALRVLPSIGLKSPDGRRRNIDYGGGALLGLATGLLLFAVTQGGMSGFASFPSIGSFIGSLLAGIAFVWRSVSIAEPFVPLALFRNRYYVCSILVAVFTMFAYFAVLVFVPLMVVEVNGLSAGQAGWTLLPGGAAVAILSPFVGRISDRIGTRRLIVAGVTVMGLSTFYLSTVASGASPALVAIGVLFAGIAFALTASPANNAAASALKQDQVGIGIGLFQGALYLGAGVGAGILGALLSARQEASESWNPLYHLEAVNYSDAFLAATGCVLMAWIAAWGLRKDGLLFLEKRKKPAIMGRG
ncbi:MFS transporter [Paenibacillus flagellatus]|uniref:Major facilitator superfamily (MFS) profile domain-containing protein n=1 Tax=Paenibacillus flagellatus TaxID=2211139 RepID=A0A2V5KGS6_9BACL|nr:MFS transporter [Paenibacillus flagellatus]PYI53430.1 hypothetical protein DLM86_16780 [Paenibacillus flagellatus]